MAEARFKYPESDAARPRGGGGAAHHVVSGGRERGCWAREWSYVAGPLAAALRASGLLRRGSWPLLAASRGLSSAGPRSAYLPGVRDRTECAVLSGTVCRKARGLLVKVEAEPLG